MTSYCYDCSNVMHSEKRSYAALYGHLNCLKREHLFSCSQDSRWVCRNAAMSGHLDCLKYAHKNGYPWNEDICEVAAENGHLNCLKYAHENGCPWGIAACEWAAINGHLDCLKYVHENGCPWDKNICKGVARYGILDCLKYAHENGCPCNLDCKSTTWCEYRCDVCWKRDCNEHDSIDPFRKYAHEYTILYKDVIDMICSFV